MQIHGVDIHDTFAEGFRVWAGRLIVTALDDHWLRAAALEATGYGTSVIACDAEAAVERYLDPAETPDGRPGAALLFFQFKPEPLGKALLKRAGQCLMTCPTTAVFDGLPDAHDGEDSRRLELGSKLRYFGDGHQKSKQLYLGQARPRRFWRIPVMDGEFVIEENFGAVKAVAGGNFLLCGPDQAATLGAARAAVDAMAPLPNVATPFPGGVVRSGSKVGSRYKALFASTNDAFCPTLRSAVDSQLPAEAQCVYEIVINGLTQADIDHAMRIGIAAACRHPITAISAGNYGGKLGKFHFHLRKLLAEAPA